MLLFRQDLLHPGSVAAHPNVLVLSASLASVACRPRGRSSICLSASVLKQGRRNRFPLCAVEAVLHGVLAILIKAIDPAELWIVESLDSRIALGPPFDAGGHGDQDGNHANDADDQTHRFTSQLARKIAGA